MFHVGSRMPFSGHIELPITDRELDKIIESMWIRRKSDPMCNELWEKLKLVREVREHHEDYKRVLRQKHAMVI